MPQKLTRYYFGRLNLITRSDNKRELLLRALNSKATFEKGDYVWGFFDVGEITYADEDLIYGYLVKLKPSTEEEVADIETHQLEYAEIRYRAVAKSLFFLHVRSGLIAYHPVGNQIRERQFRDTFVHLLQEAYPDFLLWVTLESVQERLQIFEAIKVFETIHSISINLHPTNPRYDLIYKQIDERIKRLEADSYTEIYKANPRSDGLQIQGDQEIESKITMADDGYGEAKVTGEIEGKVMTISTKDNPITAEAPGTDDSPKNVLNSLWATFKHIRDRIRHEQ